ncbi:hypothetical protein Halha_1070 [Halobacteroides halobius DSM 5150]|uniref:Dinitrogenase iron-molybdenum cofactor biosynthesis domain-containing protein n=1 Tax=Halobacteroides halobius (strain ATCC 35273 / DSM 5150 / MD-1) TaxID=748449 RepID=L0K9I9_HALHC|nr:NifB/NifX family molybdenum-iron cluster-binding protein [Halobacteroides halobius]AGB41029.1 hypothetical protein Halha_1070 [Halobacteroides halobius DSM 5150]
MQKLAIPTNGEQVASHFGRCPEFTIVEIEGDEIVKQQVIENPGHKPGFLPRFLNEKGVDFILAGGMGRKAVNLFDENNIEVVTGATGEIDTVIKSYLANSLETEEDICDHDHDDHDCDH